MVNYWIGRTWLKAFGWRVEGEKPVHPKYVLIAAPHTSNWDMPFMLAASYAMRVQISWMGKHTLFAPPWGGLMKWLGGIPIDRRSSQDTVKRVVEEFERAERLVVVVPPQGTRAKVPYWKSGFYHIAAGAKVPIGLAFLDFENKVCGLGPFVMPSGDIEADMDLIRGFYKNIRGKHPERETVPRLREEDKAAAPHTLEVPPDSAPG